MQYTSHHHHHHHLVARSKSIAVSTMRRQEGRSVARRNAEYGTRPERLHREADQGTRRRRSSLRAAHAFFVVTGHLSYLRLASNLPGTFLAKDFP